MPKIRVFLVGFYHLHITRHPLPPIIAQIKTHYLPWVKSPDFGLVKSRCMHKYICLVLIHRNITKTKLNIKIFNYTGIHSANSCNKKTLIP